MPRVRCWSSWRPRRRVTSSGSTAWQLRSANDREAGWRGLDALVARFAAAERNGHVQLFPVAPDGELHDVAGFVVVELGEEARDTVDLLTVDGHDDITRNHGISRSGTNATQTSARGGAAEWHAKNS